MLRNDYTELNCSVARTLEVVGERWSLLVVRDAFWGIRRFDDFQRDLGISRNVLAARLTHLVELGILQRERYCEHPERFEYRLTERGLDLFPVLMAMADFGDRHALPENGPPRLFKHKACGGPIDKRHLRCERCGVEVEARDLTMEDGPGLAGPHGAFAPAGD